MNYFFPAVYCTWLLSEVLLNRLMRSSAADKQGADKSSLSLIWIVIIACMMLAGYVAMHYSFPFTHNRNIRVIGACIILLGVILRLLVIRSLGKFFTVDVTIRENHQLKKSGFYRYLRHPSYAASLLSFIGFGLSVNNWVSLLLAAVPVTIVFLVRIQVEEQVLTGQFGQEYIDYSKTTKKLIPFLY